MTETNILQISSMLLSKSADVFHKYGHAPIDKQRDILLILLFLKFLSDNFKTQYVNSNLQILSKQHYRHRRFIIMTA